MKCVSRKALYQIKGWKRDFRVWAAFLLGFGICLKDCGTYLSYVNDINGVTQILEPFLVLGSRLPFLMSLMLGGILLLSDAPFIRPITEYEVLRGGYRRWFVSEVAYILAACALYFAAMLASSCIIALLYAGVYTENSWSEAMRTLAVVQPDFVIRKYAFSFPFPEMVEAGTPVRMMLETFVFETMYASYLGICMLVVNLLAKRDIGWIAAAVIHIFGYISYTNAGLVIPLRFSPLCCALTAYHYIGELHMPVWYSFFVLFFLCAILTAVGYRRVPKTGLF